jgi:hypothetical protein
VSRRRGRERVRAHGIEDEEKGAMTDDRLLNTFLTASLVIVQVGWFVGLAYLGFLVL